MAFGGPDIVFDMRPHIICLQLVAVLLFSFSTLVGCGGEEGAEKPPVTDPDPDPDPDPVECIEDCATREVPPCMKSVCNDGSLPGTAGECTVVPVADGTSCDDGNRCTVDDSCMEGACTSGQPKDCSEMNAGCRVGTCDPGDGTCVTAPAPEGTGCDDLDLCTVGDACVDGVCMRGEPMDCSELDSACTAGICDPSEGACIEWPRANGTACDDGDPCTIGDSCMAGTCTSTPMDCSAMDSACSAGVCEGRGGVGVCTATPTNDGAACDGGDPCTVGSTCSEGTCSGGTPTDCSHLDTVCTVGTCNRATGACASIPTNVGGSCDDGDLCTTGDVCNGGTCRGLPKTCSSGSVCSVASCNPVDGNCMDVPIADGTPCGDVDLCTLGGTCLGGACDGGTPKDCSSMDSACMAGVCNPWDGTCVEVPANEGLACDDGLTCTDSTVCTLGVCAGGNSPACSMTPDGCCPNSCTEFDDADCGCPGEVIAGNCVYVPSLNAAPNKTAARAQCTALGAGWDLCSPAVMCMAQTYQYLGNAGCACGGGAGACACSGTVNIYMHVDSALNQAHYTRNTYIPGCNNSNLCTNSVTETCGTPLCCKAMP